MRLIPCHNRGWNLEDSKRTDFNFLWKRRAFRKRSAYMRQMGAGARFSGALCFCFSLLNFIVDEIRESVYNTCGNRKNDSSKGVL